MGAYVATNGTDAAIPVRDDAGKVFVEAGQTRVIQGDQHAPAFRSAGFDVVWVQSHKEIEAMAAAEDARNAAAAESEPASKSAKSAEESAEESAKKPSRKATVTARERE